MDTFCGVGLLRREKYKAFCKARDVGSELSVLSRFSWAIVCLVDNWGSVNSYSEIGIKLLLTLI